MQKNTNALIFKRIVFLSAFFMAFSFSILFAADNVGIGTTAPDTTAILDLVSTSRGFLVPRLTTAQRNTITSPATGLLIYNTSNSRFEFYSGSWLPLLSSGSIPLNNGQMFVGNGSNVATGVNMSGAGVLSNTGVLTLLASSIRDSNVATGAAIGVAKLAAGSNNQILRTASGTPAWWTPTYIDTGATAGGDLSGTYPNPIIGNLKVTTGKLADNSVDGTKINLTGNIKGDLMYYNGTDWVRVGTGTNNQVLSVFDSVPGWQNAAGGLPSASTDNTLRYDGSGWVANTRVLADSTGILALGAGTYAGSIYLNDGSGPQTIRLATSDVSANRVYTLPETGANANFLMSEGNQTVNGRKTFTDTLSSNANVQIISTSSTPSELRIYEGTGTGGGQQYVGFKANAINMSANITYELPYAVGSADNALVIDQAISGGARLVWKNINNIVTTSLDSAYNRGSTINVDATTVDLVGTLASNPILQVANSNDGGTAKISNSGAGTTLLVENSGTGVTLRVNDDASDTTPFVILNDGTVGIGVASPSGTGLKMQVTGGYLRLGSGGTIDSVNGAGDLYVQDYLEVDGSASFKGNMDIDGGIVLKSAVVSGAIVVGNRSFIKISSFTSLSNGLSDGQVLIIEATASITINDSGNINLTNAFNGDVGDTLTLIWDGSTWTEISRSDN